MRTLHIIFNTACITLKQSWQHQSPSGGGVFLHHGKGIERKNGWSLMQGNPGGKKLFNTLYLSRSSSTNRMLTIKLQQEVQWKGLDQSLIILDKGSIKDWEFDL